MFEFHGLERYRDFLFLFFFPPPFFFLKRRRDTSCRNIANICAIFFFGSRFEKNLQRVCIKIKLFGGLKIIERLLLIF